MRDILASEVDIGLGGGVLGSSAHSLLDLTCHGQKCLLNVGGVLSRGLQERDAQRVGKLLGHSVLYDLLVGDIGLVTHKQLVDALGGVSVNLVEPSLDVVECVLVSHIVDDNDTVGSSVV